MTSYPNNEGGPARPAGEALYRSHSIPGLGWFYALWTSLAALSAVLGHSTISSGSVVFLLGGITSTQFFFFMIARSEHHSVQLARLLATYQSIMGIAWTTAYFYFSGGGGDLVLGMYMTVLMFAVSHLPTRTLLGLGLGALGSYLLIFGIKLLTQPAMVVPLEDSLRFLVLLALTGWIYLFARRLHGLRLKLQDRNDELEDAVRRVTRIAEEDELTKSFNRRYIMDVVARESARANRSGVTFSLLILDLDHFKQINDAYGHVVGDQILSEFAHRIKRELRGMDSVNATDYHRSFGRYGGEEFIAVLPETMLAGAERCAERLRECVSSGSFGERYDITVSVGVAEYQTGESTRELLTRADQALYRAKRDGRNLVRSSLQEPAADATKKPSLRLLR